MTTAGAAPEVHVQGSATDLTEAVAAAVVERLGAIQATGSVPKVVLAGGSIIEAVHRALAHSPGAVDWSQVEFWFGDERYVDSFSADRNSLVAQREFLTPVGAAGALVHLPPAADSGLPLHDAVATYAQDFPVGDFDLVMLGMGPDGHTASLFPGRADVLDPGEAVGILDSPKPPSLRLSMTAARLSRATEVWVVASGVAKAEAVENALTIGVDPVAVPVAAPHGREATLWWLDTEAAAFL
jgi:6-phosphogluconolactonase